MHVCKNIHVYMEVWPIIKVQNRIKLYVLDNTKSTFVSMIILGVLIVLIWIILELHLSNVSFLIYVILIFVADMFWGAWEYGRRPP